MDNVPDFFSESGYKFDIDPLPWTGLNTGGVFNQLLAHLGINPEASILNPALQIIFQNHRIDLCGNTEVDLKEMEREFPDDSANLAKFYCSTGTTASFASELIDKGLHLHPETAKDYIKLCQKIPWIIKNKRDFGTNLDNIREQHITGKLLEAQILLLSNLDPRNMSPISFARTLSTSLNELSYPKGGKSHIISELEKKFGANGGVVESCSSLVVDTERVIKINMKSKGKDKDIPAIYGKNLVVSTKYEGLASLLEGTKDLSVFRKNMTG